MLFKTKPGCLNWGQRKGKPPRMILQLFPQECGSQDENISRQELAYVMILQEELGREPERTYWFIFIFCSSHWPHTWNSPATVSRVLGLQMFTILTNYNLRFFFLMCVSVNAGMCVPWCLHRSDDCLWEWVILPWLSRRRRAELDTVHPQI